MQPGGWDATDDAALVEEMELFFNAEEKQALIRQNEAYFFMKYLATGVALEPTDMALLRPAEESGVSVDDYMGYFEEEYARRYEPLVPEIPAEDRITEEDRQKVLITVRSTTSGTQIEMMTENYVYVTHFQDSLTKLRYLFNLRQLALRLIACGVDFTTDKFAKVTLRLLFGPSHLFFFSGRMLETGVYNPIIARKALNHTLRLLKHVGYENVEVRRRRCENIVAKGTLKFELCLLLLRHLYPRYVTYNGTTFVGAIIRLSKSRGADAPRQTKEDKRECRPLVLNARSALLREQISDDDDDDEEGEKQSATVKRQSKTEEEEDDEEDEDEEEEEEDAETDDDDDDEYDFLEVCNDDEVYNSGFDFYNVPAHVARDLVDDGEMLALNSITVKGEQKKKKKKKPRGRAALLGAMRNPEEMDEGELEEDETNKKHNVTVIVFERGRIIVAGSKSTRGMLKCCAKVLPMLEACRKTPHNVTLEKELAKQEFTVL